MLVIRVGLITLSDALFVVGSLLIVASPARRRIPPQPAIQVAVTVGLIATLAASTGAVDPNESILVGLRVLYVWTVWQFGIRSIVRHPKQIAELATSFALGGAISSLVAVAQATGRLSIPGSEIVFGRVPGLATHVNGQGGVLAVVASVSFAFVAARHQRLLHSLIFGTSIVGIVLAGSVTGLIGAAAGVLAAIILGKFSLRSCLGFVLSCGAGWIVAANVQKAIPGVSSPLQRLADTTGQGSGQSTLYLRLLSDQFAWNRIQDNPWFGAGLDDKSGATYDGITQTHNLALAVWFQGGILLLIAFLIVLSTAWMRAWAKRNRTTPLGVVVLAGMFGAVVFAMTGPVIFDRWFWFPFVLALALPAAKYGDELAADRAKSFTAASPLLGESKTVERRGVSDVTRANERPLTTHGVSIGATDRNNHN
jgi:O-antigen ligase